MIKKKEESSGAGSIMGFQLPLGKDSDIVKRKKLAELVADKIGTNSEIVDKCLETMDESCCDNMKSKDEFVDYVRDSIVREWVKSNFHKVNELVRKNPDGGYTLYAPHKEKDASKKGKPSKKAGQFASKLAALRVSLSRFPPESERARKRIEKEIERLSSPDATKKTKKDSPFRTKVGKVMKKEENIVRGVVKHLVREALFREEDSPSGWSEQFSKLSRDVVAKDAKLAKLVANVEKRKDVALQKAMKLVKKTVGKDAKIKYGEVKVSRDGKSYVQFSAELGQVLVQPLYVYVDDSKMKIEISDSAKAALTKVDPSQSKLFRADLVQVQEGSLDKLSDVSDAIEKRDAYMSKLQDEIDAFVNNLNPVQITILKQLLVKKYRGASRK